MVAALTAAGSVVPNPVHGVLLLDTGASATCISTKAATTLGLIPTRFTPGYGVDGPMTSPVFPAMMTIPIAMPSGQAIPLSWVGEVTGARDLEKQTAGLVYAGKPIELIGLLGRDVLRFTRLQYDGLVGTLMVEFDLTAIAAANPVAPIPPRPPTVSAAGPAVTTDPTKSHEQP